MLVHREGIEGACRSLTKFTSKLCAELPIATAFPIMFSSLVYRMAELSGGVGRIFEVCRSHYFTIIRSSKLWFGYWGGNAKYRCCCCTRTGQICIVSCVRWSLYYSRKCAQVGGVATENLHYQAYI